MGNIFVPIYCTTGLLRYWEIYLYLFIVLQDYSDIGKYICTYLLYYRTTQILGNIFVPIYCTTGLLRYWEIYLYLFILKKLQCILFCAFIDRVVTTIH